MALLPDKKGYVLLDAKRRSRIKSEEIAPLLHQKTIEALQQILKNVVEGFNGDKVYLNDSACRRPIHCFGFRIE